MSEPIAWIGPSGELMLDQVFQDWSRGRFAEDVNGYKPLHYQSSRQDDEVRKSFDAYYQGLTDLSQERIDRLLAHAEIASKAKRWPPIGRASDPPEAITTELECTGIDQYAIEIEQAGRRIRYEAPSVEGVHALMCAHSDYTMGITPDMKVNP